MKEIQFPKDFSNIVTKLLSEPGDFNKRDKQSKNQNYKPNYKGPSALEIANMKELFRLSGTGDKEAIKNIKSQYNIDTSSPEGRSIFGDLLKRGEGEYDRFFNPKPKEPSWKEKGYEIDYKIKKDAYDKSKKQERTLTQRLSDWTNDVAKANPNNKNLVQRSEGQNDLDYVSKNIGEAAKSTTENFKEQLPRLRKAGKNVVDSLLNVKSKQADKFRDEAKILKEKNWANSDEYTEYLNSGANTTQANDWLNNKKAWAERKAEKLEKKAARREGRARSKAIGNVISNIGNAIDLGLDTISSRHRQQTIAEGGQAALMRKKARFAQMMGDDSFMTRVAAGNWGGSASGWNEGYGIRGALGRLGSKIVDTINPVSGRIRSTKKNYQRQLQYMDSLRGYDYSEQEEQPQVEPLSWQPEEYDKLNFILNREYEENQNFSEQQTGEQDLGFYDASKLVDIASLTPEKAEALLSKSYYKVSDEEKRYQESIAKGFSEEYRQQKTYENFLNECSEIYDSTSWR